MSAVSAEVYNLVYSKASKVRLKYGFAQQNTSQNIQNSAWIMENIHKLPPPDIALLAEYNRDVNVRKILVEHLMNIQT